MELHLARAFLASWGSFERGSCFLCSSFVDVSGRAEIQEQVGLQCILRRILAHPRSLGRPVVSPETGLQASEGVEAKKGASASVEETVLKDPRVSLDKAPVLWISSSVGCGPFPF